MTRTGWNGRGSRTARLARGRSALGLGLGLALALAPAAEAGPIAPREGWEIARSGKRYAALLDALKAAVVAEGMAVVTEAGPTEAAKARGVAIPGNRVVGVFRNDLAVRTLAASTAAMIEAPIRLYVTEAADGAGWLSYKRPSFVLAPYLGEGGEALRAIGQELDQIFARIARHALEP